MKLLFKLYILTINEWYIAHTIWDKTIQKQTSFSHNI
jgi:hypothetical protein